MYDKTMKILGAAAIAAATITSPACADFEGRDDTIESDRFLPVFTDEFWTWYPWAAGNGDLQIHEGETTEIEECLIFDLAGPGVSQQTRDPNSGDIRFELALTVDENDILDPDGNVVCSVEATDQANVFQLQSATGEVLLTGYQEFIFAGDVDVPSPGHGSWDQFLQDQVLYSYKGDHVYVGGWWDGNILATTTEQINNINPMRSLLVGGLVDGQCGAVGIELDWH